MISHSFDQSASMEEEEEEEGGEEHEDEEDEHAPNEACEGDGPGLTLGLIWLVEYWAAVSHMGEAKTYALTE